MEGAFTMKTMQEIIAEVEREGWDYDRYTSVEDTEIITVYTSGWTYTEYEFNSKRELIEAWSHDFVLLPRRIYPA